MATRVYGTWEFYYSTQRTGGRFGEEEQNHRIPKHSSHKSAIWNVSKGDTKKKQKAV